eukprot:TRINITY_DN122549_c0_g1_i1.p1 TRINITY_DN122549_c0_g1~~TRINITY_DN122549_c0_g1_i1.p1  ORF type:complete len:242 (-),score=54.62 TRINITY_DN122549_c0_g1_i1:155-880(-)
MPEVEPPPLSSQPSGVWQTRRLKDAKVVILGLPGSGKTTFARNLPGKRPLQQLPEERRNVDTDEGLSFRVETVDLTDLTLHIYDVVGRQQCWKPHLAGLRALVYLVDASSADKAVLKESMEALARVMEHPAFDDGTAAVLLFLNKMDAAVVSIEEVQEAVLAAIPAAKLDRPWEVYGGSAEVPDSVAKVKSATKQEDGQRARKGLEECVSWLLSRMNLMETRLLPRTPRRTPAGASTRPTS